MPTTVGHRPMRRPAASVALALALIAGVTAGLTGVAGGSPKVPRATFNAVVSLSPKSVGVGQRVNATVSRSTLPKGDKVKRVTLSWGDHTKTAILTSLKVRPAHRYARPGRYTVVLSITDRRNKTVHRSVAEVVTAFRPPVGSYTAANPQNGASITFYVSANRSSLEDISVPDVYLTCQPGGATESDHFVMAAAAIKVNGSFATTTTERGVYSKYAAKFTFTFKGNYEGANSSGVPSLSGTFRETVTYTDSAARTCSSGSQTWMATRDTQPAQSSSLPPVGSYTAGNPQNGAAITFYVSFKKTALQDISIPDVYLSCAPDTTTLVDHLTMASIALKPDGSFNGTTTQQGIIGAGYRATFTYTFRGNFHGVNPSGTARAAGTFRETITYTDTAARTCTSDDQAWTAARDTQPAQTLGAPAGAYSAVNPQNGAAIMFSVSNGQGSLQNISIPDVYLTCAPPGGSGPAVSFSIASAPITPALSFAVTTTADGTYNGKPAKFTYTFRGNFHGVNASGAARVAGMFSETVTYTNVTAYTCMSDLQAWTAARTGP